VEGFRGIRVPEEHERRIFDTNPCSSRKKGVIEGSAPGKPAYIDELVPNSKGRGS